MFLPSPMCSLIVPAAEATGATAGAAATGAASASAAGASSSAASSASYLSTMSGVTGVKESTVLVSFDPLSTWPSLRAPSVFSRPESIRSGKIAGSSKLAGSRTVPSSALQHSTAGSFACCLAVSAVIDISIFLLKNIAFANAKFYIYSDRASNDRANEALGLNIISCSQRYPLRRDPDQPA